MLVLELASSTGSSRGRSSKTTKKSLTKRRGKLKMLVLELASSTRGRSSKTTKKSLFEGAGSSKWWFWNWPAARAAAGAGVPKPPKNRFLKAREAQNAGFGTGQQHGQQQGQEFQNHQKIAF